eukprot:4190111-Alexandrium_andersonii.AAC.1
MKTGERLHPLMQELVQAARQAKVKLGKGGSSFALPEPSLPVAEEPIRRRLQKKTSVGSEAS